MQATQAGRLAAYFSVTAVAGNDVASITVYADNGAGGARAGVRLGGNVFIDGNLTIAGSINTAALADFAVNGLWSVAAGAVEVYTNPIDVLVLTVSTIGKPLLIQVGGQADNSDGLHAVALYRDGSNQQIVATNGSRGSSMAMVTRLDLPAGTHTFRLRGSVSRSDGQPGGIVYPALIVTELKK